MALGDAMMLQGYLGAIQYTYNSLLDQGVDADFIVAFRGPAVALLTTTESGANYPAIAGMLQNMSDMGITVEACAISLRGLLGPDYSIVDTVEIVPNTFISSMVSQTKKNGYAVISIM